MALDIGRKGQVSIEFILIVTIALFYITSVVWPIVNESTIQNLDALTEGEYQRRRRFEVLFRHVELVETLVESIEEIIDEVNIV